MDDWTMEVTATPTGPDAVEVRRALELLLDLRGHHMIQSLPSGRWAYVSASDLDAAVETVRRLSDGGKGTYISLNPVPHPLDRCMRSSDVVDRRWFLVDLDRRHKGDDNATDAEHNAVGAVAGRIDDELAAKGWPAPVLVDSGNGWHLLYRVELPADKLSQQLLRRCLIALAEKYDSEAVEVDRKTHDAKRITKLPGTWARKGPHSLDRPHRMARLACVPPRLSPVPFELLQDLAGLAGETPAATPPPPDPWDLVVGARGDDARRAAYMARALDGELLRVALAPVGSRNDALNRAAYALGQLVAAGLDRGDVWGRLSEAARRAGLGEREIGLTIASGFSAGMASPRQIPAAPSAPPSPVVNVLDGRSLIIWASEVTPRRVEWLWPGRVPLGKLITFAGQGGLGKTFVLLDMASRVSRGAAWPDGEGKCAEPGKVLIVSGEDDPDDTLVPRLMQLDARLDRIAFLRPEAFGGRFTLDCVSYLDAMLAQMGGGVRYVAIDPPTSFLGRVDSHKDAELRGMLTPLKDWAARHKVAVVFNTHINKGGPGRGAEAAARVMGSVAWVNAVRAAHIFARDPEDPGRRLMIPFKCNLSEEQAGLAYRIIKTDDLARIIWDGPITMSADEAIQAGRTPRGNVNPRTWLIERFRARRSWPSAELLRMARDAGLGERRIWDCKKDLGIVARRDGPGWAWEVPPDWPHMIHVTNGHESAF